MDLISFQKQQLPASFAAIKLIGIILEIFCSAIRINPANATSNIASTFIFCSLRDSEANYCQSPALSSDHCLHFSPLLRVLNVICRKHWQRKIAVSCLDNFVWCPIHSLTNNSRSNPVNRKALHVKQVFAHNLTLKKCPPKWANWKQGCLPWLTGLQRNVIAMAFWCKSDGGQHQGKLPPPKATQHRSYWRFITVLRRDWVVVAGAEIRHNYRFNE